MNFPGSFSDARSIHLEWNPPSPMEYTIKSICSAAITASVTETMQAKDYSKFNRTFINDPEGHRRKKVSPMEMKGTFDLGASLLN